MEKGHWVFYSQDGDVTHEGTYADYQDYCERTVEYANGRYANNIGEFVEGPIPEDKTHGKGIMPNTDRLLFKSRTSGRR